MGGRGSSSATPSGGKAPRGEELRTSVVVSSGGKEKQQVKETDKLFTSLGTGNAKSK